MNFRKKYTDKLNQDIVKKLISEAKGQDPTASHMHLKGKIHNGHVFLICMTISQTDADRRFFLSKSESLGMKEKGLYNRKVQKQRRRNRIIKVARLLLLFTQTLYSLLYRSLNPESQYLRKVHH